MINQTIQLFRQTQANNEALKKGSVNSVFNTLCLIYSLQNQQTNTIESTIEEIHTYNPEKKQQTITECLKILKENKIIDYTQPKNQHFKTYKIHFATTHRVVATQSATTQRVVADEELESATTHRVVADEKKTQMQHINKDNQDLLTNLKEGRLVSKGKEGVGEKPKIENLILEFEELARAEKNSRFVNYILKDDEMDLYEVAIEMFLQSRKELFEKYPIGRVLRFFQNDLKYYIDNIKSSKNGNSKSIKNGWAGRSGQSAIDRRDKNEQLRGLGKRGFGSAV
jgi:hypothetical protein